MNTYNNSNGNYHDAITEDYNKIGSGSNSILKYLMIIKALTKLLKNETIGRKQAYRFLESEGFKGEYYEYLRKGVVNG